MESKSNKRKKKLVHLLSGGLDSPVSLYLMAKRGYEVVAITFLTGDDPNKLSKEKVIKIAKKIKELTGVSIKLYVGDHDATLERFSQSPLRKLTCVMCKRYMLRAARYIAIKEKADFISNGDILGEQASQTLDNIVQIQKVIDDIPVIRPLIGFEKAEVIKISQSVGLYELSSLPAPPCGRNPKYPETHAKENDIRLNEENIHYDKMVENVMKQAEIIQI